LSHRTPLPDRERTKQEGEQRNCKNEKRNDDSEAHQQDGCEDDECALFSQRLVIGFPYLHARFYAACPEDGSGEAGVAE
jgi:hypothetical protein